MVCAINRVVSTVREHIATQKAPCIRRSICIRIDEPAVGKVVVPALEVVKARLTVVIVTTVAKRVDVPDEGRIRGLFAVSTMHGVVAPRAVVVRRDERAVRVQQRNDIALRVEDVVVELRCLAVLVDHGERLVAVVVHELEGLVAPSLPHDLAGERGIGIGRRALVGGRVDLLAAADTGHVVSIGDLLAVHRRGGELAALRPREGIVLAVVVRDGVAGGWEVARLRLPLIQDILGRAVCRHAREQVRPRGIRVAKGLRDRAVFRNTPDVARRIIGAAAQRDTAGNDDDLWLCADGCTHHSDHLSIFLRAVLMHRPRFAMKLVNDRKNSLIPRRKIFRIIVQRFPRPDLMESNRKGITTAYCNVDCKLLLRILRLDIIIDEPAKNRRVYSQFRKLFI